MARRNKIRIKNKVTDKKSLWHPAFSGDGSHPMDAVDFSLDCPQCRD